MFVFAFVSVSVSDDDVIAVIAIFLLLILIFLNIFVPSSLFPFPFPTMTSSPSPSPRTPRARPRRRARDDDESTRVDRVVLGGITAVDTAIGGITAGCGVARAFEDSKTIKKQKKQNTFPFTTLELPSFDLGTSRMRSARSTN